MHSLAIVIPAYKEKYLNETLESIANQTDKRFTLYIGDDCSPNNIGKIVDEFKDRINIRYHRFESNLGGSDLVGQWQRCIELTNKEEYIWLFSDDDKMETKCVESFYRHIESRRNQELFHFDVQIVDNQNNGKLKTLPIFPNNLSAGEYLKLKLTGKIISFVVEFIFARNLYNRVGGFQNFDLAWGSDFITWLKMCANTEQGIYTIKGNNCKVIWRKSNENISPDKTRHTLVRKINSLIGNAKEIKRELLYNTYKYRPLKYSFRWFRFPLGEIWRNRKNLTIKDQVLLCTKYIRDVLF